MFRSINQARPPRTIPSVHKEANGTYHSSVRGRCPLSTLETLIWFSNDISTSRSSNKTEVSQSCCQCFLELGCLRHKAKYLYYVNLLSKITHHRFLFIACFQLVHQEQLDRFTWHPDLPPCRVPGTRTSYLSTCHATGSSLLYLDRYQYHCVYPCFYLFLFVCLFVPMSVSSFHFKLELCSEKSINITDISKHNFLTVMIWCAALNWINDKSCHLISADLCSFFNKSFGTSLVK